MKTFRILGALVLASLSAPGAWGQVLTLEEAVQEAQAHGADQAIWAANLEASRAAAAQTLARAGLTVSANAGYGATKTTNDPSKATDSTLPENGSVGLVVGTPLTSLSLKGTQNFQQTGGSSTNTSQVGSATLSQVLWNGYLGGPAQAAADKASLNLRITELNAQASRHRLILALRQAYFTLLSAQESLAQLTQARDQRTLSLQFVQTKINLAQATQLDLLQAKLNLQSAELDLRAGAGALAAAQGRLANLLGRPSSAGLVVALEAAPDPGVSTPEEAVALALRSRVEPKISQWTAQAATVDEALAMGSLTPSVTLTGSLAWTRYQGATAAGDSLLTATVGVNLGQPLLDGGLAGAQIAQAQALKRSAETSYRQVLQAIPVDVTEAWDGWKTALGRLEVAAGTVEVAAGQRAVTQTQFDAGLKTLNDLQTSEMTLSSAQLSLLKAKITAQLAALTLQSLMGQ